ncbi:uncharacterized protein BDZ99DRAFT_162560 [Mytilinidion resinicola]|uniref:Uncharacterized protein n=1 Tax=Mytilinidion resinicola TaxID=574789 RepID=A0A6A6Y4K0_9PEZI|nr:uncharacterized protein BDZ99DRAFT_162560 [Mytilinidion resinicola]KAF2803771.1 hypothetical protein BDZ99DRAFT_162560 [Mytilinidion resinicola]
MHARRRHDLPVCPPKLVLRACQIARNPCRLHVCSIKCAGFCCWPVRTCPNLPLLPASLSPLGSGLARFDKRALIHYRWPGMMWWRPAVVHPCPNVRPAGCGGATKRGLMAVQAPGRASASDAPGCERLANHSAAAALALSLLQNSIASFDSEPRWSCFLLREPCLPAVPALPSHVKPNDGVPHEAHACNTSQHGPWSEMKSRIAPGTLAARP